MLNIIVLQSNATLDGMHLFILSGQSNMGDLDINQSFIPIIESNYGSENVIIVKYAKPGKPIRRWYKNWETPYNNKLKAHPDLYDSLMNCVNAAIENKTVETVTFVWMQGERDAAAKLGGVYKESLLGLYKQVCIDLNRTDVNFIIGRLNDFDMSNTTHAHWTLIRNIQVEVADSNPRFEWVNTDDLNSGVNLEGDTINNDIHMSLEGYNILGERFAKLAIQLIENNK